ncbi:ECM29-like protein [Mya arenaria]|uniref:ECM29-like protein n=1 Tax=Mya arenaria TaxID=6604 RepID=A0ABY7FS68_MYAAR|nr:ECM29-like protein [Mya arenaria]
MASSDENAETDEQLESALARFLTPVLLKLDSKEDGVMELLVHVNKRLKSLTRVQLPVDDLIVQFKNPEASSINFTVIYIKLGFPRLEPEKQGERVPALLSCLEGRSQSQQDSMDQRREMFACITTPAMSKLLLTYMLDLLLVPYGSHAKIAELQQAQTRRPATAPANNTPNPIAPPGLSITSFRRVMGDNPYQPEQLEKVKLGIVKFLGGDLFTEKDVVCHYIVGAADTRHRTVDLNDSDILTKLFAIILGTLEFKGQTPIKPEFKVMQACTRIRMKIMPYILKARESANTFPCNIQDRKVLSLAYVALGKLVHRFPQLVATNIALVQVFFDVMCQEEPQARMMAVQYAEKIFPKDHVASRYILLLAAGDQKEDIRLEAVKGLHAAQRDEKLTSRPVEPAAKVVLPDFSKMVEFVKEKADIRVTTQNRVVISNSTLPFNQTTFTEILLYLRSCLAHSAGLVPDMDGVSAMKEQAPEISKYVQGLMKENNTDRGPVQTYVNLTQMLLKAVGGSTPMYCLLEMVAMAPTELTTVFSMKDDIRDLAANLYAIIVCKHTDEGQLLEALEFMLNSMNNKSLEAQHGAILTLGHLIARLVKVTDENNPMLAAGACQAIGEIGRNAPLPLPSGSEGELEGEITKLSVVKNLLAIIKSGKENTKSKERAALCLGQLCVGEEKFPHRKLAIQGLLDAVTSKQIELHFTLGEALVFAAQGPTSPAGRDLWTQTEEEWKAIANYSEDEVEWYLTTVLERYVTSANPHVRQASSVWLLALVKKCNLTQDISSKGLGLVYEICSTEQKSALVSELVDTLMTGKRKQQTVSAETQVFEEGSIGKTPEGSGLSTYKELCSIANELNQPDLIYKFMHLANHHAMWNSRKGAAFGFTTIAAQAGEQLAPFLPQIVPRLYRYQFDPNMKIQQAMTSIWNALVQDNKNTVDKYMKEILADLLTNLTNNQWRIRESSCLAVHDLLRGRALDDVVESLPELWESCLRVLDDIKESASIKICDVSYGKVGERATTVVLPCLLKCGLQSPVSEVRALGLSTILKISKNAGVLLKPHIPVLVTALLEAISGLEPQLDNARIMASKMSPMMETVNLCVQYVDESVLPEMVPRLTELIKSGIGVGTKLMGAFLNGVADRNMAVRKSYALALGHLVRIAKDSSVEKLITRMRSWYLEKEEEAAHNGCGLTLHAISQQSSDILKRHASLTMPLAFLAMHELAKDGSSNKGDDSLSLWEEVWTEVTPGTEGGIKLYLAEIVSLLQETIQSQSWATKAQAARAISTVADKLGAKLGPPHLGNLIEALLLGLQGRTWAGKIIEDLLRESRKESIKYKLEALTCLGEVVEIFEVDRFQDVYAILAPVIEKKEEDMEVDEEKEELNSDVKEGQLVCYYTVLGQIWPIGARNTQEARLEGISCLLCEALQGNTRKIQEAIMKTMHKVITRISKTPMPFQRDCRKTEDRFGYHDSGLQS